MKGILSCFLWLIPMLSFAQHDLTIRFEGLSNRDGNIMLALRDADGKDLQQIVVDIPRSGVISYTFENLAAGQYTAACYHDENENEELDKTIVGLPTEKYGFSNDARGTFGPPDLSDQRFRVNGDTSITITLE